MVRTWDSVSVFVYKYCDVIILIEVYINATVSQG